MVGRILPGGEEAGPARDELRVPGEEKNSKCAEQDEDGLLGEPVVQRCKHAHHPGLGQELGGASHSKPRVREGAPVWKGFPSAQGFQRLLPLLRRIGRGPAENPDRQKESQRKKSRKGGQAGSDGIHF